jgi:hypothetical protein
MPAGQDVHAYDERRLALEDQYWGKFVFFNVGQLAGAFDGF